MSTADVADNVVMMTSRKVVRSTLWNRIDFEFYVDFMRIIKGPQNSHLYSHFHVDFVTQTKKNTQKFF